MIAKIGGLYVGVIAVELAEIIDLQSIPGLGILGASLLYAFRIAVKANDGAVSRLEEQVDRLTAENERLWERLNQKGEDE